MAKRRMFSVELVDSDRFGNLSMDAQLLYVYLGLHADDEGFVASARRIARFCGAKDSALAELEAENFLLSFPSGVMVIVDWYGNNALRKDRSTETNFTDERAMLEVVNDRYVLAEREVMPGICQPSAGQVVDTCQPEEGEPVSNTCDDPKTLTTQDRLGKDRSGKVRSGKEKRGEAHKRPPAESSSEEIFSPPDLEEIRAYCGEAGLDRVDGERFLNYYTANGWIVGRTPMKNWRAALRNWDSREKGPDLPREDWEVGMAL